VFQQSKIDAAILARSSFGNRSVRRVRASQLRFLIYNSSETMRGRTLKVRGGGKRIAERPHPRVAAGAAA